jgi:hypothetical protein
MKVYPTHIKMGTSINLSKNFKNNIEEYERQLLQSFVLNLKKNISSYTNVYLFTYRLQGRILEVYQDYLIIRLNNKASKKVNYSDINYIEII